MAIVELSDQVRALRQKWVYRGDQRPPFAQEPDASQESVWDYPRPPRMHSDSRRIRVQSGETVIARTSRAIRVLETAGAPTFYIPPDDVTMATLVANGTRFLCEWKGMAEGMDMRDGPSDIGWRYVDTFVEFSTIQGWVSFYPAKVACWVDDERVEPQAGGYYGGWITSTVVGPFKGDPGTEGL